MTRNRSLARRAGLVATAVTTTLVLAACGGADNAGTGSDAPSASASASAEDTAGAHNDQDVTFAQGMIPHHQQALQMSKMAASRASSAEVKDLAARIEKAQAPEIKTLSGWLKSWGEDVPSGMPGMDHGDHDASGMHGMMDAEDMDKLKKGSGKGFDTMFLTMMVEHHEGAVKMAEAEKEKGRYGPAKDLADDIITAQTEEIEEMNKLLGKS